MKDAVHLTMATSGSGFTCLKMIDGSRECLMDKEMGRWWKGDEFWEKSKRDSLPKTFYQNITRKQR